MNKLVEEIEKKNSLLTGRRAHHTEFVHSRDRERQTLQMVTLAKEMDKLKFEESKTSDLETLRKAYLNMLLSSYDAEKSVLQDQQDRLKQQTELEKRYRELEIVHADSKHRMNEMAERVKLVLDANAQGLQNQLLENNLADIKAQHELKRDILLGEAAIKFDFLKKKEEVADLKKRMFQKYQLGKTDNMKKLMNKQAKRYLEDDSGATQDFDHFYTENEDDAPYLTKMARKAQSKMKDLNYSLSEEDSEIMWKEPQFDIKPALAKPKPNLLSTAKDLSIRVIQATNLPENVMVVKAEIKLLNLKHKSVVEPDFRSLLRSESFHSSRPINTTRASTSSSITNSRVRLRLAISR